MIKFWTYKREYKKIRTELLKKIDKSINRGTIFFGKELLKFEKDFVKKYKGHYGFAVRSGTDALLISLKAKAQCDLLRLWMVLIEITRSK